MKIIKKEPVSYPEAKKILLLRSKERELGYEQKASLEHLRKFSKIPLSKAQKLQEELKQVEKLREEQIIKIINLMPTSADDIKVLFSKDRIDLKEEEITKILDTVKKYL